jgi:hypothetical protein
MIFVDDRFGGCDMGLNICVRVLLSSQFVYLSMEVGDGLGMEIAVPVYNLSYRRLLIFEFELFFE